MKIALVQMKVLQGNPNLNVANMLRHIEEAKDNGVDLVVFPELCISGYLVGDSWTKNHFCRDMMDYGKLIRSASDGIAVAFGNVWMEPEETRDHEYFYHPSKDGRTPRRFNAIYVYQDGKPVERKFPYSFSPPGIELKTNLPNYRVFDEQRYFTSKLDDWIYRGCKFDLSNMFIPFEFDIRGQKYHVGFELCEDLWCADYRYNHQSLNPTKFLVKNGASIIVNLSASPWTAGKNSARDRRVAYVIDECKKDNLLYAPEFFYCNNVWPGNNGKNIITFDGGSTIYGKDGKPRVMANCEHIEEVIVAETDTLGDLPVLNRQELPIIRQKRTAIISAFRYFKDMIGIPNDPPFVIGLSGGIDSAVVTCLAIEALGSDKVELVNMPSKFNSTKTISAAEKIAQALGKKLHFAPISELSEANMKAMEAFAQSMGVKTTELQLENVQAKIRGTSFLSNFAAVVGGNSVGLMTNNGNKDEVALSYFTMYGDLNGAFCPIGDLTKEEVYELARDINTNGVVIPEELIPASGVYEWAEKEIQPSAELKANQYDPIKFGYHCKLVAAFTKYMKAEPEDVLRAYIDGTLEKLLNIPTALINRYGLDNPKTFLEDIEWFCKQWARGVAKRIQAPPIVVTSPTAFGFDLREAILPFNVSLEYEMLKGVIGGMEKYKPKEEE